MKQYARTGEIAVRVRFRKRWSYYPALLAAYAAILVMGDKVDPRLHWLVNNHMWVETVVRNEERGGYQPKANQGSGRPSKSI